MGVVVPILQMGKVRQREVISQDHTVRIQYSHRYAGTCDRHRLIESMGETGRTQ